MAASFYSKSLRCLRWTAGPKRPQLLLNMYSTRPQTRASGAYGTTSGLKLLTVAYERHAFAYGNLDCATPCLAYSSGVLTSAQLIFGSPDYWKLPNVDAAIPTSMRHKALDSACWEGQAIQPGDERYAHTEPFLTQRVQLECHSGIRLAVGAKSHTNYGAVSPSSMMAAQLDPLIRIPASAPVQLPLSL